MVLCWPRCLRATDRTRNAARIAGAFCTSASPWSRDQAPRLPASERKCQHLAKSGPGRFWYCPLWPPDKNVRLQIPSYPESIWCVLRIKSKSAYPLSQALTCFHRHSSSQGEAQTCPQEGAPRGRETPSTQRVGPLSPHPTPRGGVTQPEGPDTQWQKTDCWVSWVLQPHTGLLQTKL